jgi:hypothetical protein
MTRVVGGNVHLTRNALLCCLAVSFLASPAIAGSERAGTSAANFLTVGTGPAVLAMGGAGLGRSGGIDLASANPGALGFVDETSIRLAHSSLDDQSMQEWATMGGRFGHTDTHWAIATLYQYEGSMEGRDASNVATETFSVGSAAGMLQLAQAIGPHVAVGMTGKYVLDDLGPGEHGSGMTFDAGVSARVGPVGLGFAAQNFGGYVRYGSNAYPFPTNYGGGVSYTHDPSGVSVACDVNVPSTSYTDVRTGLEWSWKQHVALRAGYRAEMGAPSDEPLSGPTFGTGLGTHGLWFDYGYMLIGNQGGQHRVGITLGPSAMKWKPGDPFGQGSMPKDFDTKKSTPGPPAPTTGAKPQQKH